MHVSGPRYRPPRPAGRRSDAAAAEVGDVLNSIGDTCPVLLIVKDAAEHDRN
jgi:hypothetical protein